MTISLLQLLGGFIVLTLGGHYIVKGAVSLALLARVATAVVGLTVVAFGTSLPEMAVSVNAAAQGSTDIAYANIIGSCIFNIAVILSLSSIIKPVLITRETKRFEYPAMIVVLIAALVFAIDGTVQRVEGITLAIGLAAFLAMTVRRAKRKGVAVPVADTIKQEVKETPRTLSGWTNALGLVSLGLVGLWFGADLLVTGASDIARGWGISERVIGLTIIAMGTSLPELAASAMASYHGEHEIALSNLMGSNVFNILAVLGITAAVFPVPVNPRAITLDNWAMLGFSVALLPILLTGNEVKRWHGALLLTGFAGYFVAVIA